MIRIYGKNIKKLIDLKTDNWINNKTTNCYAFALGLDIPEKDICYHAYNGGIIYQNFARNPIDISGLTNHELIELDFKTIHLYFEQIDLKDRIYSPNEWKIALFNEVYGDNDFHFFREVEPGLWYHKYGREDPPKCFDEKRILITNPIHACLGSDEYEYQHCYRLSKQKF